MATVCCYRDQKEVTERERQSLNAQIVFLLDKAVPAKRRPDTSEEKAAREERSREMLESLPSYDAH